MPAQAQLAVGAVLDTRYRIEAIVAEGSMGVVYRATRLDNQRAVAVKELVTPVNDKAFADRFRAEVAVLQLIQRVGFPKVHAVLEANQRHYLVMDYIYGQSMDRLDRGEPPKEREVLEWALQTADLLNYMHSRTPPMTMLDLKPSNVMLDPTGKIWLLDFGLARLFDQTPAEGSGKRVQSGLTPGFAAPEQNAGEPTDGRTDLYALGAIMYYLLAGQAPPEALKLKSAEETLPALATIRPKTTPGTIALIEKLLSPDPKNRPETAREARNALQECRGQLVSEDTAVYERPGASTGRYSRQGPSTAQYLPHAMGPEAETRLPSADPADEPLPAWVPYVIFTGVLALVAAAMWMLHIHGRT